MGSGRLGTDAVGQERRVPGSGERWAPDRLDLLLLPAAFTEGAWFWVYILSQCHWALWFTDKSREAAESLRNPRVPMRFLCSGQPFRRPRVLSRPGLLLECVGHEISVVWGRHLEDRRLLGASPLSRPWSPAQDTVDGPGFPLSGTPPIFYVL